MTASFNPAAFTAILMGEESLTIACGDMLLAGGHQLVAVVSTDAQVRDWAAAQGLPLFADPRALLTAGVAAEWLLSIANLRIIPREVLALPARGAINFHDGPLPAAAGLNTPAWAIIEGAAQHGVTWHLIEGGVDEGDILETVAVPIAEDETAYSLNAKCYAAGMESFGAVLGQLEAGSLARRPQDLTQRRLYRRDERPEGGGLLDLSRPARALSALARGLDFGDYWNPLGRLKLALPEGVFLVDQLEVVEGQGAPGMVLAVSAEGLTLAAGAGAVRLTGLSDFSGAALDPRGLAQAGDLLPQPAFELPDPKAEPHWRATLRRKAPLALPLSMPQAAEGWTERPLRAPAGQAPEALAAAALLSFLGGAWQRAGLIALARPDASPLAADWVPLALTAEADGALDAFRASLAAALEAARTEGAMARDLPLRDPELATRPLPPIALSFDEGRPSHAALTLHLGPDGPRLAHDRARLSPAAADLLAARLEAAFAALDGAETCGALWTLPETERAQQDRWNETARPVPEVTLQAAFAAQVACTPEATALVWEGESLSYAALDARADALAEALLARGLAPGTPVGLHCRRRLDLMVGALGILKAGLAYLPLDPAYPAERLAHYLSDSAAPLVVTEGALAAALPEGTAERLLLDDLPTEPTAAPTPRGGPDDLAYLIYTSGSTGQPKGVKVTQANLANFFTAMDQLVEPGERPTWLAVTSLSFDISVLELFWTLTRGFKVILADVEGGTRLSAGPVAPAGRRVDFNLMYWGNDDGVGPKKYELLLEGARFADAHGFNAVWTPERHFHAFGGPYPNPSVTGAAVAAVTQNLAVRAGSCVAPLHHPARIAEEWAVIDNLTNGRVGLAIASGWQPDDFVLRPENTPPENKPAMYRTIDQLRALWAGEPVEFPKQDGTPHAVVTQPRPVSKSLPIWVTTAGNPETWREAGEKGANVLTHLLGQTVDEVAEKIAIYHAALRAAGHDPADFTVTLMLHAYLAESREAAARVARAPMKDYLRAAAGLIKQYAWAFPAFKRPAGTSNPFELDLGQLSEEELEAILDFAFERYFTESGLFGTVEDGLARVAELRRIGVDEVACLIDYGIAPELVLEGLKPLAEVLARANRSSPPAETDFSLAAQIVRHGVTHLQCTPSLARMLLTDADSRATLAGLRQLFVGGEALPGALAEELSRATPAALFNMYGPTETTIWSSCHRITPSGAATAPIGRPIANTQVFILDEKMATQPTGVEGNLWIGGAGVTAGYWQREEATAANFRPNPFGPGQLYRTGDLARLDAEGCLHFGGRADAQVKIRGHRIEPGEVEALLLARPGVREAVVVAREMQGTAQLVAYLVAEAPVDPAALRAHLSEHLPPFMLPAHFVQLDRLPLTPNRKVDRKALPTPRPQTAPAATAQAPASGTQATIAEVWRHLLGVQEVRAQDNFFALGGHSLLAVQANRDLRQRLGRESLSITDIFRFPTLGALAAHLEGESAAPAAQQPAPPAPEDTMARRRAMRARRSRAEG